MLGNPIIMGGGVSSIEFPTNGSAVDPSNLTTYTFSSHPIGTAAGDRKVAIIVSGVASGAPRSVSTLTVGGVSATLVTAKQNSGNTGYAIEIWQANVPAGTTGDVVVTWDNAMLFCGIGAYAIYNAALTAYDTGSSEANPMTDTLDIPAGGVAIGGGAETATATFAWTNLTEDYDETIESTSDHTGASDSFMEAEVARVITCTQSANNLPVMVLASWGPA